RRRARYAARTARGSLPAPGARAAARSRRASACARNEKRGWRRRATRQRRVESPASSQFTPTPRPPVLENLSERLSRIAKTIRGEARLTAANLAKMLAAERQKKPLLVSCDVYRPAAIEQLRTLAGQIGVDFFPSAIGQKPMAIALAALDHAKKHYHDVLLVDTAGRLAID